MSEPEAYHNHDHTEVIEAEIPKIVIQAVLVIALLTIVAYFAYAMYRERNSDRSFNARMDRLASLADRKTQVDVALIPMGDPPPKDIIP